MAKQMDQLLEETNSKLDDLIVQVEYLVASLGSVPENLQGIRDDTTAILDILESIYNNDDKAIQTILVG